MASVYVLGLTSTAHVYVGCTRGNVAKRLREHRCLLKAGKHTCTGLQAMYDHAGGDLVISVAMTCDDDLESRRKAELLVMDLWEPLLLNEKNSFRPTPEATRKGIEASRHVEGRKRSPEANLKRRLAQLGKPKGHGAKISATKQARKAQQEMR